MKPLVTSAGRSRNPLATMVALLTGSVLLGAAVGVVLIVVGLGGVGVMIFLAYYVMGDPCSPVAMLFEGPRPPFC